MSVLSRLRNSVNAIFGNDVPDLQRHQIEAGGGGRRWQGSPMLNAPQASILAARAPAKAGAAALSMNNPAAARIVETWLAALAGRRFRSTRTRRSAARLTTSLQGRCWPWCRLSCAPLCEAIHARMNPAHELSAPARQYANMRLPDVVREVSKRHGTAVQGC